MSERSLSKLITELNQLWTPREPTYGQGESLGLNDGKLGHFTYISLGAAGGVNTGLEVVTPQHRYDFDGMRPTALSRAPIGVFQYTLEGWGELEVDGIVTKVPEEHALIVKVPSKHCYRSASKCRRWVFIWIVFDHPYLIERLFSKPDFLNRALNLSAECHPIRDAVAFLKIVWSKDADPFEAELALYRLMLALERWLFSCRHPEQPRQSLLNEVRHLTLAHLDEAVSVEWIARKFGLSRTHFTHFFTRTTGISPAGFMREVRLHAAAGMLREKNLSVKEVAARSGFADANHLCKVFRAQFHLSPGAYRHLRTQMPSPAGPSTSS